MWGDPGFTRWAGNVEGDLFIRTGFPVEWPGLYECINRGRGQPLCVVSWTTTPGQAGD